MSEGIRRLVLSGMANQIASELGLYAKGNVTILATSGGVEIRWGDVQQGIEIVDESRETHYKIFLLWPTIRPMPGALYMEYRPAETKVIRVHKKRTIAELAKEIQRRLLPGYDEQWNAQVQRAEDDRLENQNRHQVVRELNKLLGYQNEPSERELSTGSFISAYHNIYEVHVSQDGKTVNFKTHSMPVEVAKQVLELMVKLNPRD